MKKRTVAAGVIVLAVLAAVVAHKLTKKQQFAVAVPDPMVQTINPSKGNISLETALIGSVEPNDVVYIYAKASGDVTEVNVKAGDAVQAGDPVCSIDTKQVTSAKNNMDSAALSLKKAQEDLQRNQVLYDAAGISPQEYESFQNAVKQAQITYDSAKANYETQQEYASVTAAISGTVELVNVEVHDNVSSGKLIGVISGEGAKIVSFSVTERIRDALKVGDRVRIEKDGKEFSGSINEISSMADSDTGLFKVKADLDDASVTESLPTGSMVKLHVTSSHAENVLTVPINCIYYSGGDSYVYTADTDGTVHKVAVETGIQDDENTEILSGVTESDRVISTWTSELDEGNHVRVQGDPNTEKSAAADAPAAGGPGAGGPGKQ